MTTRADQSERGTLTVRDLTLSYGKRRVLDGLTLPDLAPGEMTVLLGPNATGKSTTLKALAGLHKAGGEMHLGGLDLNRMSAAVRARLIGFMPQTLPAVEGMSVLESVIAAAGASWATSSQEPAEKAVKVLGRLGILDLALLSLARLSGGQRQLVSLAQTMVRDPHLLLLDEPASALDPARAFGMMKALRSLADEGRVLLVVLHDLALAAQWADRLIVMHQGSLYAAGAPQEVLTPQLLAEVYGVVARVERCSRGKLTIQIDDLTL